MIIFGGVGFFLRNLEIFTQIQVFSIYYVKSSYFIANIRLVMSFLCLYVIVIDKSMFCTLSGTFRPSFGLLQKLGVP